MLGLGPHAGYIIGAYGIAAIVLIGLILWVVADHRAQKQALAELEARGVRRRSDRAPAGASETTR